MLQNKAITVSIVLFSAGCYSDLKVSTFPQQVLDCRDLSECKAVYDAAAKVADDCSKLNLVGGAADMATKSALSGKPPSASDAFEMAGKANAAISCASAPQDLALSKDKYDSMIAKDKDEQNSAKVAATVGADRDFELECVRNLSRRQYSLINVRCFSEKPKYFLTLAEEFCASQKSNRGKVQAFNQKNSKAEEYLNECKPVFRTTCKKTSSGSECKSVIIRHECNKNVPIPLGFKLIEKNNELLIEGELSYDEPSNEEVQSYEFCQTINTATKQ